LYCVLTHFLFGEFGPQTKSISERILPPESDSNRPTTMILPIPLVVITLPFSCLLLAQVASVTGTVQGVITDPTGAGVPYASATIANGATGFVQTTTLTDLGRYQFPLLPIGSYSLTVHAPGFKTLEAAHVRGRPDRVESHDCHL
jgi:hypothetical protein